ADDDAICDLACESSAAIVVTKRADDFGVHNAPGGKVLLRIPAFAFLYLLGHAERHGYKGSE
ncbi:MAG TPA: AAA family ATPase, partial [Bacillota bacterium]|nr:AAA family ATPase [Bacillota bacterium]